MIVMKRRRKMEKMRRRRRKSRKMMMKKTMTKMARMRKRKIRGVMTSDSERLWFATRPRRMVLLLLISTRALCCSVNKMSQFHPVEFDDVIILSLEPREPRKRSMYFKGHSSPTRRRFRFSSTAPRSPYNRRTSRLV